MRLIQISAMGLPLFPKTLTISFLAKQRVDDDDKRKLCEIIPGIYVHCANAFIGINASGKTSILKVILLALGIMKNEPINYIEGCSIMGQSEKVHFEIAFVDCYGTICRLDTDIASKVNLTGDVTYYISNEKLWEKSSKKLKKKEIVDFNEDDLIDIRKTDEQFLPDDVSFIIARNKLKCDYINVSSVLYLTDFNMLPVNTEISMDIVTFLDPTIEQLRIEEINHKKLIHLKFYGRKEILLNSREELESYLSSGTIKGIVIFSLAKNILKTGGYMLIDEIENHFNHEIVATLIRFFMDTNINRKGADLIFTTHYPELLDEYDRNDGIYIMRNNRGIEAENLSDILKRNDIKRSEAYQSGLLEGTTPAYESYLKLRKSIITNTAEV